MQLPLKVIDASTVLAGPSVATFFAELGATVIKLENPAIPDVTRSWKLTSEAADQPVSAYFSSVNYRKTYQSLNLRDEAGQQEFLTLVRDADILITNFKKGDAAKFGITDDRLLALNPRLIHGKISGYGQEADRVAYDLILQAETGFMSMNGTPESGPVKMPVAFIDVLAAHQLKEGILLALYEREKTGKGKAVHVSLYKAAISSLMNQASNYLMAGHVPQRIGSLHPNIAPYGELFLTADQQWLTFAIGSDHHFERLCVYLGEEAWSSDARFADNQARVKNRKQLADLLAAPIGLKNAAEILSWAEKEHVPAGVVRSLDQVFQDPEAQAMIREEEINGMITRRVSAIAFE